MRNKMWPLQTVVCGLTGASLLFQIFHIQYTSTQEAALVFHTEDIIKQKMVRCLNGSIIKCCFFLYLQEQTIKICILSIYLTFITPLTAVNHLCCSCFCLSTAVQLCESFMMLVHSPLSDFYIVLISHCLDKLLSTHLSFFLHTSKLSYKKEVFSILTTKMF